MPFNRTALKELIGRMEYQDFSKYLADITDVSISPAYLRIYVEAHENPSFIEIDSFYKLAEMEAEGARDEFEKARLRGLEFYVAPRKNDKKPLMKKSAK